MAVSVLVEVAPSANALDPRVDVKHVNADAITTLHGAAARRHHRIVRLLVEKGARFNAAYKKGQMLAGARE